MTRAALPLAARRPRGFTLVELLIALAILAVLALLGYRALASLTDSEARLAAEAEQWRALDRLFARLESDCRAAQPRVVRIGNATEPAWFATVDSSGNSVVRLSRAGTEFFVEPGSAGQRIAYRLNGDAIEVLYSAGFDEPAGVVPTTYALARGIASFNLEFLDDAGSWLPQWPAGGTRILPRAIHAVVTLRDGTVIERWLALQ